ncbi:hypothetical protein H6B07_05585 [Mediterraneibacter glycyrrhizinilyticus]|nr:hypothetical protein [Mediterraneibacter glycyrrhizinilyticus]MBM6802149.1 hypothetical protein [Mediterraneibacter glycyrrhizinilyticus]
MKKDTIKNIKKDIPIANYDERSGCFQLSDTSYADIYMINPKDLVNGDPDDIERDCFTWAKFYKTYGMDIEIIGMMFPCDTGQQHAYWKKLAEKNTNPEFEAMIRRKVSELEFRKRNTLRKEFFLICFWENLEEIRNGRKTLESTLGIKRVESGMTTELLSEIPKKKKLQVLFKFANKNSQIF